MFDAQHRGNEGVPFGLRENALRGVHENQSCIGGGCAGDHIARVLFMSRTVSDDELSVFSGEEAISNIDGDTLLALGSETVYQKRKVNFAFLGTTFFDSFFSAAT